MQYIEISLYGVALRYYDDERIERVMSGNWKAMKQSNICGYKRICIGNKDLRVHRVVFKANNLSWDINDVSSNNVIDHIDKCKTNNKIENLRCVNQQQNQFNRDGLGYSFDKKSQKYRARIRVNNKLIHLGFFVRAEDAREAYLNAKLTHHII